MSQFIGITNVHEFYSEHYLAAVLAGDLKNVLVRWQGESAETPPQALAALHQGFFRALDRVSRERQAGERIRLHQEEICAPLLHALGYALQPVLRTVGGGTVPLLSEVRREDGSPLLWWLAVPDGEEDAGDVLQGRLSRVQAVLVPDTPAFALEERPVPEDLPIETLLGEIFDLDEPPRFVLVAGRREVLLIERAKWQEQKLLRFDLEEILGRRERGTLEVTAALLHRQSLVPDGAQALIDTLDESSHKHAFAVSEDLKYALREAIELLGNAVVSRLREQHRKIYDTDLAGQLSGECLRFMYRLLFLFYMEARPELGWAPMGSETYLKGYSLERLRELEAAALETEEARAGFYIHESLRLLFRMVFEGQAPAAQQGLVPRPEENASEWGVFTIEPLTAHLFDPALTPLLESVRLPNEVMQRIIRLMSLSRRGGGNGRTAGTGRVSYATLGINQLGAVYEALLSFRGFFAEEDLYEVKSAMETLDELTTGYFVTHGELAQYEEGERVYNADGTLRMHPSGEFIFRMAGRDRQKSASYYTPQVLTQAVVKYALKELLEERDDRPALAADRILELKVVEPAMGSAAFLNEAVDQLAEAYLTVKQKELGERIRHEDYAWEKQRVKMYLADNNVFGIDLNPVATELAEVSLWLNTIHAGAFVPWFGMQLATGNSLIGARRQAFSAVDTAGERADWLKAVPGRVPLGTRRPDGAIWHFLLGDGDMASYGGGTEGQPIKALCADALARITEWRRSFCAPLEPDEREALVALSAAVDRLWDKHATLLADVRSRTTDPLEVYGRPLPPERRRRPTTTAYKDRIWQQEMASEGVRASSPYRRLKLAMDYWCGLWFWPIEEAELLPSREEFIEEMNAILAADVFTAGPEEDTLPLFPDTRPESEARKLMEELGLVDVPRLVGRLPRLGVVRRLSERLRFFHWELEFADLFAERGGFDLVLGNPPWIRVEWKEADVLGDTDPFFVLRNLSATDAAARRQATFDRYGNRPEYLAAHEEASGTQAYLSARQNYPELTGSKVNLYKCFLPQAWKFSLDGGATGFLHPEGIYDDPSGGRLRAEVYPRLRRHYQFANELKLFEGVDHHKPFSINIYGAAKSPSFEHIANVFLPSTVDACHHHAGQGPVPGIKDDDNAWNLAGHRDRIVPVNGETLALFADLYDEPGTEPEHARLPALHARTLVPVLEAFRHAGRLDEAVAWFAHDMWNEARAVRAGTIRRDTRFPRDTSEWVLSGPHFYVGTPFYKTPRRLCTKNSHYDTVDLEQLPEDYLPRTNYVPAVAPEQYHNLTPKVPWNRTATSDFYRVACNRGLSLMGERTLQPALLMPGPAHIDGVYTYTVPDARAVAVMAATWAAIAVDFFVKTTGASDFRPSLGRLLPIATLHEEELVCRALALNAMTAHYGPLWEELWRPSWRDEAWARTDQRLAPSYFQNLTQKWTRDSCLRTAYARRQALVEIDVLVGMSLGLELRQLIDLYRAQFPVMRHYERDTWYDRNGRIVFTNSKGLVGVGLKRKAAKGDANPGWEDVKDMTSGTVEQEVEDDTLPGGPHLRTIVYEAPFDRCDREEDYRLAWEHFFRRFGTRAA